MPKPGQAMVIASRVNTAYHCCSGSKVGSPFFSLGPFEDQKFRHFGSPEAVLACAYVQPVSAPGGCRIIPMAQHDRMKWRMATDLASNQLPAAPVRADATPSCTFWTLADGLAEPCTVIPSPHHGLSICWIIWQSLVLMAGWDLPVATSSCQQSAARDARPSTNTIRFIRSVIKGTLLRQRHRGTIFGIKVHCVQNR